MAKINVLKEFVDKGICFECIPGCILCCAIPGMVFVRDDEIGGMAEFFGISAEEFTKKYLQRHWGDVYNLNFPDSEPCMFLSEDGCSIYKVRPVQCRTFPFWPEYMSNARSWKDIKKMCPGIGRGRSYPIEEILKIMVEVCFGPFL
jgi:uncharacterized protein